MSAPASEQNEQQFENFLGNLLRAGVLLAASVVLLGGILYLVRHGNELPDDKIFHGEPAELRSPAGTVLDALHFSARGIIQLGLLLLVATPVARVGFSAIGFLRERDFTYVALTLLVLTVLLYSLFSGSRE